MRVTPTWRVWLGLCRRCGWPSPLACTGCNALAHLPSGRYAANAAWVAHAAMTFNLARAAGVAAGNRHARTRWATIREQLIRIPV
jgi:hypothetical protein